MAIQPFRTNHETERNILRLGFKPWDQRVRDVVTHAFDGNQQRFERWYSVLARLTNATAERWEWQLKTITETITTGGRVAVIVPERASPEIYTSALDNIAQEVFGLGNFRADNLHLILSGGVTFVPDYTGKPVRSEDVFGEQNAMDMYAYLRNVLQNYVRADRPIWRVSIEALSQNTGDQARMLRDMIIGGNFDLVVFLGPIEHVPRFALTVLSGLHRNAAFDGEVYTQRRRKIQALIAVAARVPRHLLSDDAEWREMTDLAGVTAANVAFSPESDHEGIRQEFPTKSFYGELVEKLLGEMYDREQQSCGVHPRLMNPLAFEAALADTMLQLELGDLSHLIEPT